MLSSRIERTAAYPAMRTATSGWITSTYFPINSPPDDLAIVDCIEFNVRFRAADPVADMAFLVMDLIRHGRRDLATWFRDAYLAFCRR